MNITDFWEAVLTQNRARLGRFFHKDAVINWHCTNERFTVAEYIQANCDYPGDWTGEIERTEVFGGTVITAVRVFPKDQSAFYHVVSFLALENDLIRSMDEYWADDCDAPLWRQKLKIGRPIR